MTEQTNRATLYRKLAAVAGEIGAVEKDGRNKDQGYTYATPASVFRALKPILAKHQIAIVPMQSAREDTDTGRTSRSGTPYILTSVDMSYLILDGESGESITTTWTGVAGAYGDDKGNAKAQTIALRTFLIQLFQIPAEDADNDPDSHSDAPVRQVQRPQPRARTEYVEAPAPALPPPPENGRATLISTYKALVMKARADGYVIAPVVMKELSDEQISKATEDLQHLMTAKVGAIPVGDEAN